MPPAKIEELYRDHARRRLGIERPRLSDDDVAEFARLADGPESFPGRYYGIPVSPGHPGARINWLDASGSLAAGASG